MRQAAQRYVPPSRRREGGDSTADTEQRGLEGVGPRLSQVRLVALQEGSYDTSACPCDIEAQQGSPPSSWLILYPERQPQALLQWFAQVFAEGAGRLEYPASLSKRERAWWHGIADRARLHTQSFGVGDGRYLTVGTAALSSGAAAEGDGQLAAEAGPAVGRIELTAEQRDRARQIYDCCQMEGGPFWERSRGEIEAMVASGEPLPRDLQELVDRRLRGQRVCELLRGGDPTEALALLSEDPRLCWVKDSRSGGYPIHIAAWKGYESVVTYLASIPGVLQQRDGRRETALAVAKRRQNTAVEQILLEAGANPQHASFQDAPASSSTGQTAEELEYMSWSAEERLRYRHGGDSSRLPGPRAGRTQGGASRTQGRGRAGGSSARSLVREQSQPSRCPW